METTLTSETLQNIERMAEEMEKKIESLEYQRDHICKTAEELYEENKILKETLQRYKESDKIYYAFYLLVFVYGLLYGVYFKTNQQEL